MSLRNPRASNLRSSKAQKQNGMHVYIRIRKILQGEEFYEEDVRKEENVKNIVNINPGKRQYQI